MELRINRVRINRSQPVYIFTAPHTWWLDPLLNYSTNNLTYFQTQTQTEPFSQHFDLNFVKNDHTLNNQLIFFCGHFFQLVNVLRRFFVLSTQFFCSICFGCFCFEIHVIIVDGVLKLRFVLRIIHIIISLLFG